MQDQNLINDLVSKVGEADLRNQLLLKSVKEKDEELNEIDGRIASLEAERHRLREALKLARSIAASGERIYPGDEAIFDAALEAD